jgi:hypothetical protein
MLVINALIESNVKIVTTKGIKRIHPQLTADE